VNTSKSLRALAAAALLLAFPLQQAMAQGSMDHGSMGQGDMMKGESGALSDGEVRKVDKDAKKITIKHGPLANLDMPAMTMVFQVKDPALLEQAKPGDRVKFRAEKSGGAYVVTEIKPAK
jgi:Cu/Ag efflux protein CusF